jgi:hypothetical protein
MDDKVKAWRSSRLHRKCIFCQHLKHNTMKCDLGTYYYTCEAKDKFIHDLLPDFTRMPRPFCKLFKLKVEKE